MLSRLIIKNVALIDVAEIDFAHGLNVLSGETGSGKSVILEALNFALGAKADKTLIRSGEKECFVSAEFEIGNSVELLNVFEELDFDKEDCLIITRKLTIDGKSTIKVNGNTVTISMLRRFTSMLVDVHGQSEHFYLLKTSNQLELLDKIGGAKIVDVKFKVKEKYSEYKKIISELDSLGGDESQRAVRLDILNYQIDEIEKCDLKDGEEEELKDIKSKLQNQEKISNVLYGVKSAIDDEGGASDVLGNAERLLSSINGLGDEYSSLSERLSAVYSELSDIADTASGLIEDVDFGGQSLDTVEARLDDIKRIKKKYGASFEEITDFLEKAKIEKDNLEHFNERAEDLLIKKENVSDVLYSLYLNLSELRKNVAKDFSKNVLSELCELNISKANFFVKFNELPAREDCEFDSGNGIDDIKFMFSANLGEPVKPLSDVISGGEMSRFMLAIKTQTAKFNNISTFVFDEIDAGISGIVARTVAEKFAKISLDTQIIAITHLPQISAMADNNLLIIKTETVDKTHTSIKKLSEKDKVYEIVRLVGGEKDSNSAIKHAEEIIESANTFKSSLVK